jgi:hypothetical protein
MRIAGRGQGRQSSASRKNRYKKRLFTRRNQRGKAATKKEIPRRGAKTAERFVPTKNSLRPQRLCEGKNRNRETRLDRHPYAITSIPAVSPAVPSLHSVSFCEKKVCGERGGKIMDGKMIGKPGFYKSEKAPVRPQRNRPKPLTRHWRRSKLESLPCPGGAQRLPSRLGKMPADTGKQPLVRDRLGGFSNW